MKRSQLGLLSALGTYLIAASLVGSSPACGGISSGSLTSDGAGGEPDASSGSDSSDSSNAGAGGVSTGGTGGGFGGGSGGMGVAGKAGSAGYGYGGSGVAGKAGAAGMVHDGGVAGSGKAGSAGHGAYVDGGKAGAAGMAYEAGVGLGGSAGHGGEIDSCTPSAADECSVCAAQNCCAEWQDCRVTVPDLEAGITGECMSIIEAVFKCATEGDGGTIDDCSLLNNPEFDVPANDYLDCVYHDDPAGCQAQCQ